MARTNKSIVLSSKEERKLREMTSKGRHSVRVLNRVHVLLKNHEGYGPGEISKMGFCSPASVFNILNRYKSDGLDSAIFEKPRSCAHRRKVTPKVEAQVTMIACSSPPDGRSSWTLRLIQDKYVLLNNAEGISHETVRKILKKAN